MSDRNNVLIIANFCDYGKENTNNRFNYIADMLHKSGHNVELLTSSFSHRGKNHRTETDCDTPYTITLLHESGYSKNVCLKRFYSHYVFGRSLAKYLKKREKPDVVYCASPSLDAATVAAKYCRKSGIPFIIDIQDLWPEAFKLVLRLPIIKDVLFAPMTLAANYAYRQADGIVAVSETYKQRALRVNRKDKDGLCVFLGTELDTFDRSATLHEIGKPEDELWITYVGTLGHSYNIEIIIDALDSIADKLACKVVFKVLGDGPYLERFKERARECRIRVDFLGRLDYSLMVSYLTRSDIAVNPIAKGAAQSIINKHADYAAAGLPVINTQESAEYCNLVEKYGFGINCGVDSVDDVAAALLELVENCEKRELMGANSRRLAEEKFDRRETYPNIVNLIRKIEQEHRS